MSDLGRFTYPFCYTPHPEVRKAAEELINRLKGDPDLDVLFSEGKMMGVLLCSGSDTPESIVRLYAFSGLAGGRASVPGFVPPIYDTSDLKSAISSEDSREIQADLFKKYIVHNALGEQSSISDIFSRRGLVPPGGTGECAAPKLLEYAYRHSMVPLAMGEFWYGASPVSEVREQGRFYPSCTGKCGPLLSYMMKGLDVEPNPLDSTFLTKDEPYVIYSDEHIVVASKPAGMLSVPGRTGNANLQEWLQGRFGEIHSCHRLDMDTSGIMVFARSLPDKTAMELQFAGRTVKKTYRARLCSGEGAFRHSKKGTIALPLASDYYDRPRQTVDFEKGKLAVTEYEITGIQPDGEIDILFRPLTGRTHQIRVHAAHAKGLGRPIKGDRLYGDAGEGRLFLHAESISFIHPATGEIMEFKAPLQRF